MIRPMLFGKYCLLERVSVGGMAEVFRAKPLHGGAQPVDKFLALKRILPHLAEDEEFIKMFIDEAKLCVHLRHPNLVHIFELGQFQSSFYILMEFISGQDVLALQKRLRRERLIMSVAQACYIAMELCKGLDHAHRARDQYGTPLNIIHRDISPQNILITYRGGVKLIDFGVAKAANQSSKTQVGVLKGKFGYMSPEQIRGERVDHRSDIFSVGIVLWEMLTNRRLFTGESEFEVFNKVRDALVEPPSAKNPQVPEAVDRIVMRALTARPEDRYAWAADMAQELGAFLRGLQPIYTAQHLSEWMSRFFAEELAAERPKIEAFRAIQSAQDVRALLFGDSPAHDADEQTDEATRLWDAEIAPARGQDLEAFAAQHTVVAAGGFDVEEFISLEDDDLLEVEETPSSQAKAAQGGLAMSREQLAAPTMDLPRQAFQALHAMQGDTQVRGAPVNPTEVLRRARRRRDLHLGEFPHAFGRQDLHLGAAAFTVLCALTLGGLTLRALTTTPQVEPSSAPPQAAAAPPLRARVILTVIPSEGLEILLNGQPQAPSSPQAFNDLSDGEHTLVVRRPGYEPVEQTLRLEPGEFRPLHIELTPQATP